MAKKTYTTRPIDRLWGALRVWATIYLAAAAGVAALTGYRFHHLASLPDVMPMTDADVMMGDVEALVFVVVALVWMVAYIVSAFLTLKWFYRAANNANALSAGVENSPGWAPWGFIIPFISLWKPYSIASELWRTSLAPDRWKGLTDPSVMRWWWGFVLLSGMLLSVSDILSRNASTAREVAISSGVMIAGLLVQLVAGVLFLRVGEPISARQTELIGAGRRAPSESGQPAWAP